MIKKILSLTFLLFVLLICACVKRDAEPIVEPDIKTLDVLTDFANVLVNPNYQDLEAKANEFKIAVQNLNSVTNETNLIAAQNAWRTMRTPWEQSEAYLFGPAEDFNFDPATDTWPVNTIELDSVLASTNPLTLSDIDALPYSLKGYHPAEYLLFGVGSSKTAAQFTPRQLLYLVSLTESLKNNITDLKNSWDASLPGNFTNQLITAGAGSTRYATRKDAFVAIITAMANICNEVANGKMQDPLAAHDSTLVESQYAHNATEDFRNNMKGVRNAYLCTYFSTGRSLHDLIAASNISLDNTLRTQMDDAVNAFDSIDPNFGMAIFTQFGQIQNAQNAINTLQNSLNVLLNYIQTNIKD